MMELYQAFADWEEMMEISERLITRAALAATGTTVVTVRGEEFDLVEPWPRVSMCGAVSGKLGREVHPSQPVDDVRAIADEHGAKYESSWGSGRIIESLFEELCEAEIVRPTFVTGHPVEISPLARVDRTDPHVTERFEIFCDARELGNGYSELNDPVEQRQRFEEEQTAKDAGDAERGGVDEDYLRALEYGMPPTGGLGIGMDRVAMLLAGVDSIREVVLFPTMRPEQEIT
jgi:lysyl-tRNA synthetase class 2